MIATYLSKLLFSKYGIYLNEACAYIFSCVLVLFIYRQFDMSVNGADNPFSAIPPSHLPNPPSHITAMTFNEDNTLMVAFSGKKLYVCEIEYGHWTYEGEIATPCD